MPSLPPRFRYWSQGEEAANFGDYLTELLYDRLAAGDRLYPEAQIRLIGSVIGGGTVQQALREGAREVVFWGCGLRQPNPPPDRFLGRAVFRGVRGPLTRAVLDLPPGETPIGDPALLLPRIHRPPSPAAADGLTLCVPHLSEPLDDGSLLRATGAERVLRPLIPPTTEACEALIDAIAGARFVLAGALHAAIVAHAYGVPFAYFHGSRIDIPFKWADFSASIGLDCDFVGTVADGLRFAQRNARRKSCVSLDALLAAAPSNSARPSTAPKPPPDGATASGTAAAASVSDPRLPTSQVA